MNQRLTIDQVNKQLANQVKQINKINDTLVDNDVIASYHGIHLEKINGMYNRDFYLRVVSNLDGIVKYLNQTIDAINNQAHLVYIDTGEPLTFLYGKAVLKISINGFFIDLQTFMQRIDDKLSDCIFVISQFYSIK
ncbi:hypothetical protein D3P96_03010 [Weissella viridescens]|uniref:Uncharacterized protein n=1 Tax=Weissella viridescens TaxID=1629 RepID=A0A3P2RBZ8_WEIVI|nr:hypothetical protein [Weissella viridescens]RRG18269.1 hypothetical protein D3P96_03010 [Weissella viridescens]